MSKISNDCPSGKVVDSVASFVEVAEDLENEPFMSEDERSGFLIGAGENATYNLGDRTHFRSALIGFRRLWMQDEPSYFRSVANQLYKFHKPTQKLNEVFRADIDRHLASNPWWLPELAVQRLLDLWINTVFAHAGLDENRKLTRIDFDKLVSEHGVGKLEFAFREAVAMCGYAMLNFNKLVARPALNDWMRSGISPSFTISSPFGREMKERLPDGSVVVRRASSKFYTEESIELRFVRILKRARFSSLKWFLDQLDATSSGKTLLVVRFDSVLGILGALGYVFNEMPIGFKQGFEGAEPVPKGLRAMSAIETTGGYESVIFEEKYTFRASRGGIATLDSLLATFVQSFREGG